MTSVAISKDDRYGVFSYIDGSARVLDLHSGEILSESRISEFRLMGERVFLVSFSRDGNRVLFSGLEFETHTGKQVRAFDSPSTVFVADGERVFLVSGQGVKLFDDRTGQLLRESPRSLGCHGRLSASGDGRRIIMGCNSKTVEIWDAETCVKLRDLIGHENIVRHVALSPDGQQALTIDPEYTVRLWDVQTGTETRQLRWSKSKPSCIAFSPDGRHAVIGDNRGKLHVWDVTRWKATRKFDADNTWISCATFSSDGRLLLSGGYTRFYGTCNRANEFAG